MSTGFALFQQAEILYAQGNVDETFKAYQRCIKKVLKNELVTAKLPQAALVPDQIPRELLGYAWMNFAGFFLDPNFNYTQGIFIDPEVPCRCR